VSTIPRYVIFARIYVGPPTSQWFDTPVILLATEQMLLDALMAGQVEGAIDRIEAYEIGDIARDVSEDIAIALGEPVRKRIAEERYRITDELRDFIDSHAPGALPVHAFEPARVLEDA
jgi:hypothetical protein